MKTTRIYRLLFLLCLLPFAADGISQVNASFTPINASPPDYPPCTFQRETPTAFSFTKNNSTTSTSIGETMVRNTVITLTSDVVRTRNITIRKNAHVRISGGKGNAKIAIIDGRTDDNRLLSNGDAYTKAVGSRDVFFLPSDGRHMQLARTDFFRIERLEKVGAGKDSKVYRIQLPDDFVRRYSLKKNKRIDTDNVFISYGWWFYRNSGKVLSFSKRGKHFFVDYEWDGWYYDPSLAGEQWRKDSYFYLSNFGPFDAQTDGEGVKVLTFKVSNEAQQRWIRENSLHSLEGILQTKTKSSLLRLDVGHRGDGGVRCQLPVGSLDLAAQGGDLVHDFLQFHVFILLVF